MNLIIDHGSSIDHQRLSLLCLNDGTHFYTRKCKKKKVSKAPIPEFYTLLEFSSRSNKYFESM